MLNWDLLNVELGSACKRPLMLNWHLFVPIIMGWLGIWDGVAGDGWGYGTVCLGIWDGVAGDGWGYGTVCLGIWDGMAGDGWGYGTVWLRIFGMAGHIRDGMAGEG